MGKSDTTDNFELERTGRKLLGCKFAGVYASDEQPRISAQQPYAIVNTAPRTHVGEHWIAIAHMPNGCVMFYDSFGRSHAHLFPGKFDAISTEDDAEQRMNATNCGQRSLAWLLVFDRCGPNAAQKYNAESNDCRAS